MNYEERLMTLRKAMKQAGLRAYLILTGDPHHSEEPAAYYAAERRYFCPFTGDNAYVLITEHEALLWSDGRFAVSAPEELKGTSYRFIELYRPGNLDPYAYIKEHQLYPLGTDFSILSPEDLEILEKAGEVRDTSFASLLPTRPALSKDPLWDFSDARYQDHTAREKIERVRQAMQVLGAGAHLLTSLDDIAYLTNVRGNDIVDTPVFYAYLYIDLTGAFLFVDPTRLSFEIPGVQVEPYEDIVPFLSDRASIPTLVDPKECNAKLYRILRHPIPGAAPSRLMKAVKSPKEIENIKAAQAEDGVALLKFMAYLDRHSNESQNEWHLVEVLHRFRAEGKHFLGESFTTIAAVGPNAAMMHYAPSEDTYSSIDGNTLELLLDSGGQYLAGTTDTTRTFLLGKPTSEFIHDYTLTMKSLIDLSSCVFLEGSTGVTIDMMARQVMWKEHMDYKCGTGHGIGYVNVVHEGPNGFRYRLVKGKNEGCVYAPGMITSIEPGVYKAGKYGIRLENNILCVPDVSNADGNFYRFETITYVPFETKALDLSLLTDEEIAWLNAYHQLVYEKLSPWVDGEMLAFLTEKTKPIAR